MADDLLHLHPQRRELLANASGYQDWETITTSTDLPVARTALLLCDVWDLHWCRGANERLAELLPRLNLTANAARAKGVLIVHAPSGTLEQYADHPARRRVLEAPPIDPPPDLEHDDPPLPVCVDDPTSCDTPPDMPQRVWTRQHAAIDIDAERDLISDDGRELYSVYQARGIEDLIVMGVHANMCMLRRSFAIMQMVRWGLNVFLVRDLTDAQYSPAQWPYVSHAEGTRLVVEYIEKFWCPSIASAELLA